MKSIHSSILFFIVISIFGLMQSCAVEGSPTGGPLDKIPPFPDSTNSAPNYQLFFEKQDIVLSFNEWVKLENQNQIIVSPPLEYPLKVKLKGKKLVLAFNDEEQLYDNTTYTVNLGQCIVDYTQGNPMSNYTYVFSTGSFIDSLSVSGKVIDDFTKEPVPDVIVGLYDDIRDSAIFQTRPLYFARTGEDGRYRINNIRQDTFLLFALDDKNVNYYKDQESEGIGFLTDAIYLDTIKSTFDLGFYVPDPSLRIIDKVNKYGEVRIAFNRDAFDMNYRFDPPLEEHTYVHAEDSIWFWFENNQERNLILETFFEKFDTLILEPFNDSLIADKSIRINSMNSGKKIQLAPTDSLEIQFNYPIKDIKPEAFMITDTSGSEMKYQYSIDKIDPRQLKIKSSWIEGQLHELLINPGGIETAYDYKVDTINQIFVVALAKSLGEIKFQLDSLNEEYQYLIELTLANNTITKQVKDSNEAVLMFSGLKPGQYKVRVYEDANKNGRWDPGNYIERRFSERWISKNLESLKANWTLEVSVNGSEFE